MTIAEYQEWIVAVSASFSMIAIAVGIWMSLREYRIKLQAERRQQRTAEIEAEIRLQSLFSELMKAANGRSGYQVSEKAVEFFLEHIKAPDGETTTENMNQAIEELAILNLPVGSAEQDASIAAIASLTLKYDELKEPGLRALESLSNPSTSPFAERYLAQVRQAISSGEYPNTA